MMQQHGHRHQFERRYGNELHSPAVADAFCHRHSDAEAGVGTGAAAHGNSINGYGMTVGERQSLVYEFSKFYGVVRSGMVFFRKDVGAVLTHC